MKTKFNQMYTLFRSKRFLIGLMLLCVTITAHADITINVGPNPSQIVRVGDDVQFTFQIRNSDPTPLSGAHLDIEFPNQGWRFISATVANATYSSIDSVQVASKWVTRISGLNVNANTNANATLTLAPLCDAEAGEIFLYTLYDSGNQLIDTNTTAALGFANDPILNISAIPSLNVTTNIPVSREWTIAQTALGTYAGAIRVDITCDTTAVKLNNVEYKNTSGTYTSIGMTTRFVKRQNGYSYWLDATILSQLFGNSDARMDNGEVAALKETLTFTSCDLSGEMTYRFSFGNGTDWCQSGIPYINNLTSISPAFNPDLERGTITYPTRSDGSVKGKRVFLISNNSADPRAVLKDIRIRAYADKPVESGVYQKYYTAYFSDASGNKLAGTPDIPVRSPSNPSGVASPTYNYYLSDLPNGSITGVPLIDANGDGKYDDLPINQSFYITAEWDLQYQHLPAMAGPVFVSSAYQRGILYYRDACDNYITYSRAINASGSTYYSSFFVLTVNTPTMKLNQSNVRPADQTILNIAVPPYSAASNRQGVMLRLTTDEHKIYVTLPAGFEYDPSVGVGISSDNTFGNNTNGGAITYDQNTRVLTIHNRRNFSSNMNVNIGMKATNVPATDKKVRIYFSYNMPNESPKYYGEYYVPLDFNQILPCDRIELVDFQSERTTYGYYSPSNLTIIPSKAEAERVGVNLQSAGPFDNVSHTARISINNPVTLGSDRLKLDISYKANALNRSYFSFPDNNRAALLRYKANGSSVFSAPVIIPKSAITESFLNDFTHTVSLNLTSYVNSTLAAGDSIEVEFLTRTTQTLPRIQALIPELQMQVYTENSSNVKNGCSPLLNSFRLFDYFMDRNSGLQLSGITYDENNLSMQTALIRWEIGNEAPAQAEVFVNEFRPNATFDTIKVEFPGLYHIEQINLNPNGSGIDNYTFDGNLNPNEYSISYNNGYTYVTIINRPSPVREAMGEFFYTYGSGYFYQFHYRFIGGATISRLNNIIVNQWQYPTSEQPLNISDSRRDAIGMGTFNRYQYTLNSITPNAMPMGTTAEWDLVLTNTSNWSSTDGHLPNSWIALDAAAGVLGNDIKLYEEDGTTLVGSFTKYADGKYWIRIVDGTDGITGIEYMDVFPSRRFKIKATYEHCGSSAATITARYGMSNITYPTSPWQGYQQDYYTPTINYNTPQVYNTVSQALTLTSPAANSDYSLDIDDSADMVGNRTFEFCEPFAVKASFQNAKDAVLNNLKMVLNLPAGLRINAASSTLSIGDIQIGQGYTGVTYRPLTTADGTMTVSPDGSRVEIALNSSFVLDGLGSVSNPNANSRLTLAFNLKTFCGFIPGTSVRINMDAQTGCGSHISKTVNTGSYYIASNSSIYPDILFNATGTINGIDATNSASPVTIVYKSVANDGLFTMQMKFRWDLDALAGESGQITDMNLFLDGIPNDLLLQPGSTLTRDGGGYSTNFIQSVSAADPSNNILTAAFGDQSSLMGIIYFTATLNFRPQNPANWNCDFYTLYATAGKMVSFNCDGQDCNITEVYLAQPFYFQYEKAGSLDFENISAKGTSLGNQERIILDGKIANNLLVNYPESVRYDIVVDVDGTQELGGSNYSIYNATISGGITANSSASISFDQLLSYDNDKDLLLVLQRTSAINPYLCDAVVYPLTIERVNVDITAFLQGPLQSNGTMNGRLQQDGLLPTVDPYGTGTTCSSINNVSEVGNVVDWVLVEIRKVSSPAVVVERKALLLRTDGKIVDMKGNTPGFLPQTESVYMVVKHRNHLSVASTVITPFTGNKSYSFTSSTANNNNGAITKPMDNAYGKDCMWAGDVNGDDRVDGNDMIIVLSPINNIESNAYINADMTMEGRADSNDMIIILTPMNEIMTSPVFNWK